MTDPGAEPKAVTGASLDSDPGHDEPVTGIAGHDQPVAGIADHDQPVVGIASHFEPDVGIASHFEPVGGTRASSEPLNGNGPTAGALRVRVMLTKTVVRLTEIALIVVGLGFVLVSDDDELVYLAVWDLLALLYVGVGMIVLRRTRLRPPTATQAARLERFRFNFAFAIVASLIGFTVAIDIATSDNPPDHEVLLNILGVIAMVMSWILLQAGYARRYAALVKAGGGGLTFPSTDHPAPVDYLYFAITIGTAFSVSDVLVTSTRLRWHVMVHSVVSFFYNAAVVAFALSLIAGR